MHSLITFREFHSMDSCVLVCAAIYVQCHVLNGCKFDPNFESCHETSMAILSSLFEQRCYNVINLHGCAAVQLILQEDIGFSSSQYGIENEFKIQHAYLK